MRGVVIHGFSAAFVGPCSETYANLEWTAVVLSSIGAGYGEIDRTSLRARSGKQLDGDSIRFVRACRELI
jgi:hypothetical protein